MTDRKRLFIAILAFIFTAAIAASAMIAFVFISPPPRPAVIEKTKSMDVAPTLNAMDMIAMFATQTTVALSGPMRTVEAAASATAAALTGVAPTATLLPNMQSWVPPAADGFLPRFTYDPTQWALTDASTLASLQTSGCTLRRAGGRALGPGWSTEASSLRAGDVAFLTILAKYQGKPQFITYSAPNGAVFEIASASDFEKCVQDGESVLKSLTLN